MAASTEHLTAQLQNRLQDENIPVQERLDVAQKAFCSTTLPIVQKEEQVLLWIIEILQNEKTELKVREVCYGALLYCFKSNRIKSYSGNIRSSTLSKVLKVLKYVDHYPDDLKQIMRKCCFEVIRTPYFQRLFMCDVSNICKLTKYYLLSIKSEEATEDFIDMIDQFLYINKMCLMKGEFRYYFIKEVLTPMCLALVYSPKDKTSDFHHKATCVLKEILFYEPKFIENFIENNTTKYFEPNKELKTFCNKIKHMPTKHDPEIVEICYSIFLKSVISKFPEKHSEIFRIFTLLTPPLGIIINQIWSIDMNPINNWQIDNSFIVVRTLIDILDKSKMPLSCQLKEVTLQNWFTSFVVGLTSLNSKSFSANFFKMIVKVLEFNPLVIEPSCKALTMIMLQIKNADIKDAYIQLIRTVISGSSKLQRLQKFISLFLQNMRESLIVSCEEDLSLEDVLPKEISDEFSQAVVQLPNSQVLSLMKSFLFHLQRDILPLVEGYQTDTSVCINMEVICEMTYQLIQGTNIADHSVPDVVKQKFKHILEEMQVLLRQFGIVFQEIDEDRLVRPYFWLCRAFGAMKLLFREYDNIQIVAPTDVDLEPTNLCYVHNYLFPDNWKKIAENHLENHKDCDAKHEFFELLVQKIEAVAQVEEGDEGPGTQVARYLLRMADLPWLWDHLTVLAPLFQSAELAVLVKKIVNYIGDDQSRWLPLLKNEVFSENRRLVLATGFQLMVKASEDLCLKDEESLSYQVLSLIDHASLLEFELSQMITDDVEHKERIEEALQEMANILNERLLDEIETVETVPHVSVFEVPARLPLHHFSVLNQCCTLLSAVALLQQLPLDNEADMYLFNLLLKIMDGPMKNKALLGKLNPGVFLTFVAKRGKNYRGQRKLMKRICLNAFWNRSASKKLFNQVWSPDPEDLWVTALVVDSLSQFKKKHLGSLKDKRKPLNKKESLEHLVSTILPVLCSEQPSPEHLYTYSIVFKYYIKNKGADDCLSKLTPNLKEYVEFAMASYKTGFLLIESMIQHRQDIDVEDFPSWLMSRTWHLIRSEMLEPKESVSHLIFETATYDEFAEIVPALLTDTESEIEKEEWDFRISNLLNLWCHLASNLLSSNKSSVRDEALVSLVTKLPKVACRWQSGRDYNIIPIIAELISTVAKNTSISLRAVALDSYLTMLQVIPLPRDCSETIVAHLTHCLYAMFSLYLFRSSLLVDRLPAFLQRFRMFLVALASVSKPSQSQDFLKTATAVAEKMERVATTIVKRQKDFSRLAPYFIADVMSIFQQYNLSSDIKFSYTNIVNAFLSICDKHAINFLKGALPLGQQELFNNIYENYNKYNRFVGKI